VFPVNGVPGDSRVLPPQPATNPAASATRKNEEGSLRKIIEMDRLI